MSRARKTTTKKKAAHAGADRKSRSVERKEKPEVRVAAELTDAERDLVSHMEQGWRLETDSLGGNPVLRNLKSGEAVRPLSANRGTVEGLEKRGLIVQGKGAEPLRIAWRIKNERK